MTSITTFSKVKPVLQKPEDDLPVRRVLVRRDDLSTTRDRFRSLTRSLSDYWGSRGDSDR